MLTLMRDDMRSLEMYEAFDSFINVSTWHTRHPNDEQRFHKALSKVVWSDDFSPEQIASYLRKKLTFQPTIMNLVSGRQSTNTLKMLGR